MPSTTIAARRRAKTMDLASLTMTQGSFSQRYASQNIQEDGTWVLGALFVLSVVLIGIVAAFGSYSVSLRGALQLRRDQLRTVEHLALKRRSTLATNWLSQTPSQKPRWPSRT